jgi:hydroxyacylglutathione hydrolase
MTPLLRGTIWLSKISSGIENTLLVSQSKCQPVLPDIAVRSEYNLNKYIPDENVIPTPDHTSGSISLVTENKVIFVGDTLFNVTSRTVFPSFANNIPELLKAGKS